MRLAAALCVTALAAQAAVVEHVWRDSKLALTLDDGRAEIEWLSTSAVRITRNRADALLIFPEIKHDPVLVALEDSAATLRMRSRFLAVEVDKATLEMRIRSGDDAPVRVTFPGPVANQIDFGPAAKVFGTGANSPSLAQHGNRLGRGNGLLFTDEGYGVYLRSPSAWQVDADAAIARSRDSLDVDIYYGPAPKDIFEQHRVAAGAKEIGPAEDTLPQEPLNSWQQLADTVRQLNHWSLAGIQYPAFDLTKLDGAPEDVRQRALDLAALMPMVHPGTTRASIDRTMREAFSPYLATYFREGYDRGFPVLRALPIEFALDKRSDEHPYEIMLGDELLLAPVIAAGDRRQLMLPRGIWTDLRTNTEYRGNQKIEVDAPAGRVPMFARNGSVVPIATRTRMELHYMPSLGGEFFLWEPELKDNSQFHAAPAADVLRVEIETKVTRAYEWILHHTKLPKAVGEESRGYQRVNSATALRPGTWWHDAAANNLHILLHADAKTDRIINVSF